MNHRLRLAACAATFLIGSCSLVPGTSAHKIAQAESSVRKAMVDPQSTNFEHVSVVDISAARSQYVVCGLVNSRNQMGGYTGFKPFFVFPDGTLYVEPTEESGSDRRAFNSMRRDLRKAGCRFDI